MKHRDEIIEEIRRRREAHAASFGFDIAKIAEDLRRLEKENGRIVINRKPRKPRTPVRSE